jgi:splicing factor 3B subunit 1
MTPAGFTPSGTTPTGSKAMNMATPTPGHLVHMTLEQMQAWTWQREIDERNRPLSEDDLDSMLPKGYKVRRRYFWVLSYASPEFSMHGR